MTVKQNEELVSSFLYLRLAPPITAAKSSFLQIFLDKIGIIAFQISSVFCFRLLTIATNFLSLVFVLDKLLK